MSRVQCLFMEMNCLFLQLEEEQSHDRHLLISCQLKLQEETIVKKKALEDRNKAIVKLMRLETKYEDLVRENLKLEVQNQELQAAVAGKSGHTMDFVSSLFGEFISTIDMNLLHLPNPLVVGKGEDGSIH